MRKIDLKNKRFGRLFVIEEKGRSKNGHVRWLCFCDCGIKKIISSDNLSCGHTKSCGCLQKETVSKTHKGRIKSVEERKKISKSAKKRYKDPKNHPNYRHGLKGTKAYECMLSQKYNMSKLNQTPTLTELEKKRVLTLYRFSYYLGKYFVVDHIQPISKGGLHHPDNLQILTRKLNGEKSNKWPLFYEEKKRYEGFRI